MASGPRDALQFPESKRAFLEPHLPPTDPPKTNDSPYPFTTLTFATSLDSQLSLSPGAQTILSGPQSKAMTHYLRSRHDAILIGVGTAIADNPSLNCRIEGVGGYGGEGLEGQPRPIVVDPELRWSFNEESKILKLVEEGKGKAPFIVTGVKSVPEEKKKLLEGLGGKFITVDVTVTGNGENRLDWKDVLKLLSAEGLRSVMIEGGGAVINSLLRPEFFDVISSVIVTVAPTWLGQGGVIVSPERRVDQDGCPMAAVRLQQVSWHPFGEDVVMCGRIKS